MSLPRALCSDSCALRRCLVRLVPKLPWSPPCEAPLQPVCHSCRSVTVQGCTDTTSACPVSSTSPPGDALRHPCAGTVTYKSNRCRSKVGSLTDTCHLPSSLFPFSHRLAVLDAIRGYPVPAITICGSIPTTAAVAEAMAEACSHLQTLTLVYSPWYNDLPAKDGGEEAANAYAAGVVQLLSGVGPRLRELRVTRSAPHWPTEAYQALRQCTGLTSLTLEAERSGTAEERDLSKSQCKLVPHQGRSSGHWTLLVAVWAR